MKSGINDYPNINTKNPFSSQFKLLCHRRKLAEYWMLGDVYPVFMEVNLTDKCNLKCKWCIAENRTSCAIDKKLLKDFIFIFKAMGGKALTWSGGGEPTMHPDFEEITEYAISEGLELGLMTNGFFKPELAPFIKRNFKWCRVSLDTMNEDKYEAGKGVRAAKIVVERIKMLKEALGNCTIGVNANVGADYTMIEASDMINKLDPYYDYIQFRPILPRFYKEEKIERNDKVWIYLEQFAAANPKVNISADKLEEVMRGNVFQFRKCEGHFFSPILNADGKIYVCMYHVGDERFVLVDLNEEDFLDGWKSERRKKTIEFVRNFDYHRGCQVCCKLNEINKLLDSLEHPQVKDVNFL